MSDEIRSLIREVLAEELKAFKAMGGKEAAVEQSVEVREEVVTIANDSDLNAFAVRLLDLAKNEGANADIRAGRLRFCLQGGAAIGSQNESGKGQPVTFEKGLVSEKQIAGLRDGSAIRATGAVCFTPLALDEIRRKHIRLERIKR